MEKIQKIVMTIIIGVVLVVGFYVITSTITKYTGFSIFPDEENSFETCLKGGDITLYINSEDSSATLRDNNLLEYLDSVKIVNCARDNSICLNKGVNSFPTWIINEIKFERDISVSELSQSSGCNLV